ncbi:Plasmodium exported protein (PHISTa-like), unknown function [Plasmodium sp. gorilla clade G2]|uniref:Plasmodium exported protein (PHISTa-like), unknown function n=1 Tax=Plasmodium sp. gorilla clade G2 TaxID=880535 RepID=UPI000D2186A5|nr:Plasmodium exported protein (PHISTa-like), unknown function [Plasmodium sp. gorilla clade G2]SOV16398.1 Plasmodium exported protein (PHISTa-like), unknown function [Plasmodium sp. gorilla clade G2]
MAIIYKNNLKKDKYNQYSTYLNRERMEYRIPLPSTKYIEIISRNLSETETENNNVQSKNTMNPLDETNESSKNSKNNKRITSENKDNNDVSKKLKEKQLYDILNSLKECPSKDDLKNIWNHAMAIVKEDFDSVLKDLKELIQKYLDNDYYYSYACIKYKPVYASIWEENSSRFNKTLESEQKKYTDKFFSLIKGKPTLDDILKFIYSFLEHFRKFKKELHKKHKKELLRKIEKPWAGEKFYGS